MATDVILMADIDGLGREGDVVKVAEGYARNFLLPQKKAAPVTAATRRQLEKKRREREEKDAGERAKAQSLAGMIAATSCTITVKTGPEGKLFGAVSAADITENLAQQGIKIDRHQLSIAEPIRELGVFNVSVKLHPEVDAALKIWVVEE